MNSRVVVVAAHPDDEVLGLGGTIARHCANGDTVNIVFLSDGVTGRDSVYDPKKRADGIEARREGARQAAKLLGVGEIEFIEYPNLRMDRESVLEVTQVIERCFKKWSAEIVYIHNSSDTNIDHQVCFKASMAACRPVPGSTIRSIRCFEVPSSTEYSVPNLGVTFVPNLFVEIEEFWNVKLASLKCYDSEMRPYPFPRSVEVIEAMAICRGASVGIKKAEAFCEIRKIET